MGEEQQVSWKDKVGPGTLTAVLASLILAATYGAVAMRDLVLVASTKLPHFEEQLGDHEARLRTQERREPRLQPIADELRKKCDDLDDVVATCKERVAVTDERIRNIEREQETARLCARVQACKVGR